MNDKSIDRREFARRSTMAAGGLVTGTLVSGQLAHSQEKKSMPQNRLVLLGLNALARAHKFDYFADGHRGASMVAAHLLIVDNGLDKRARARIEELFDLNWAPTELCQPFPDEQPQPEQVAKIGEALAEGGEVLRQVGHNAIFAMLAIKAFRMLPDAATPQRIDGVCKLIRSFTPWRDVEPDKSIDPPPFMESAAASKFVVQEASDAIERFIGFGQGFAGHMLTFGQALIELAAMGDVKWANSCRTAFRKYVTVTRKGPEPDARRFTEHKQKKLRPTDTQYWVKRGDRSLGIGHVFKYPYSCYELLRYADDPELTKSWDAKAWRLF